MTEAGKQVAAALAMSMAEAEARAEIQRYEEKLHARKCAKAVIYAALAQWTGIDFGEDAPIPIVRQGEHVGSLGKGFFGSGPVEKVLNASLIDHKSDIEKKISELQAVAAAAEELIQALGKLSYGDRIGLDVSSKASLHNIESWGSLSFQERILREMGTVKATDIVTSTLVEGVSQRIEALQRDLAGRELKRGRPRNEAAHAVALELARLYAKVTGKSPTYSSGKDGLSGEYTPVLRDVFDALGWKDLDLRGPAENARDNISEADLRHEEMTLGGLLSAAPPNWQG